VVGGWLWESSLLTNIEIASFLNMSMESMSRLRPYRAMLSTRHVSSFSITQSMCCATTFDAKTTPPPTTIDMSSLL
jgi:hypothetical protein